jgi:hypothetical protein
VRHGHDDRFARRGVGRTDECGEPVERQPVDAGRPGSLSSSPLLGYYPRRYRYGYDPGAAMFAGAALGLMGAGIAAATAPRYYDYGWGGGYYPGYYGGGYYPGHYGGWGW